MRPGVVTRSDPMQRFSRMIARTCEGLGMSAVIDRPAVRHIYQNHHLDTQRWDGFKPRRGDIVISTSYKAGTTLMQTIICNLLFPNDDLPGPATVMAPWLDMRISPLEEVMTALETQTH